MCICVHVYRSPWTPGEGVRSLRTGVKGKSRDVSAGNQTPMLWNVGPLKEQELPLQPKSQILFFFIPFSFFF